MKPIEPRLPKKAKRIPDKNVVWIAGRPIVVSDAEMRKIKELGK